jgi:hypothetical protein
MPNEDYGVDLAKKAEESAPVEEEEVRFRDRILDHELYTNESGEEFVYVRGLLRIAWGYAGMIGYESEVIQAPERKNAWSATVVVKCTFRALDPDTKKYIKKYASGAADCRQSTAGEGFEQFTTAMAETRALGRALRRYLGIDLCTVEEQDTPDKHPITDNQRNCIEKKFFKTGLFTLKDVSNLIERDVASLTELNGHEASVVIMKLNKALKKRDLAKKGADAAPKKAKKKKKATVTKKIGG